MKISFCLSALYGVTFLHNETCFQLCEAKLGISHTKSKLARPGIVRDGSQVPHVSSCSKCTDQGVWVAFSMVPPGLRADSPPGVPQRPKPGVIISISRLIAQPHTVPPLSNTSPDLTTSTAESTESHTFFFGTGASTGTVYARTKWMIGRLARDLGPVRKVVSSMLFERLGQVERRANEPTFVH